MYVKPKGPLSSSEKFMNGSWMEMGDTQMIWQVNLFFFFLHKKLIGKNCIFNVIWDLIMKIESRREV